MKIGFDVDGVLADFNLSFIQLVIDITGEDKFPPRPFDIPTWHYPQHYGYSEEVMDFHKGPVWGAIKSSLTFWSNLSVYAWTIDVIDHLMTLKAQGHDIYFITDRPGAHAKEQTEHWLHWMGFDNPTVLISGKKALVAQAVSLDCYIDDKFENALSVSTETPARTFLLNRPWNVNCGGGDGKFERIDEPQEMFNALGI